MKQGFVMFLAVLFLSIVIALVQTQATGTVAAAEDGSPVIGALIKPKSVIRRLGKSYLLFTLFRQHLIVTGVADDCLFG